MTVTVNRVAVIAACVCWSLIVTSEGQLAVSATTDPKSKTAEPRPLNVHHLKDLLFLVILLLGVIERLSRLANLLSIERDWVPTLAVAGMDAKQPEQYDLTHLNAIMGRIDLICKIGSPIAISAFMSATDSPRLGCFGLLILNLITWPFEYWTARTVWHGNEQLRGPKSMVSSTVRGMGPHGGSHGSDLLPNFGSSIWPSVTRVPQSLSSWICQYWISLRYYFATEVWMPSLAMTSLHFSVLTFSATLTVFLLHSGFPVRLMTWAEVLSAVFELSSTIVFPWGVRLLGTEANHYTALSETPEVSETLSPIDLSSSVDGDVQPCEGLPLNAHQNVGVSRLGMWALGFMLLCLVSTTRPIRRLKTDKNSDTSCPSHSKAFHE